MDLAPYIQQIEAQMRAMLVTPHSALAPFYNMMQYHLGWMDKDFNAARAQTGKRLRPVICLLMSEGLGGSIEAALPAAAAIELIHNFSLIHDDIEDASPLRRHRETLWHIWGIPQAINAGDGMLMISHLALQPLRQMELAPDAVLDIVRILDETCLKLCQGQYLDIAFETRTDITMEEYLVMIGGKTASLIAASAQIGAMIATNDSDLIQAGREFGWQLGLAFQMVDDILGIWGDAAVTGKSAASDITSCKKTLPILFALEQLAQGTMAQQMIGAKLRAVFEQPAIDEAQVPQVLEMLDTARTRDHVQRRAEQHTEQALEALRRLGAPNGALQQLGNLASDFLQRTH